VQISENLRRILRATHYNPATRYSSKAACVFTVFKLKRRFARLKRRCYWALQNVRGSARFRKEVQGKTTPLSDLTRYERRIYSQNGEDGILQAIFARVGVTNSFLVEFGIGSGRECNTRRLIARHKWKGLWMTANPRKPRPWMEIQREFITAENVQAVFAKHGVPRAFDLLSIDIDGNEYWVWKALTDFRPRVVVIEYNATVPPDQSRSIPYDPEFVWPRTDYMGASLLALSKLGSEKGYTLVACDSFGINAFFVDNSLAMHFEPQTVAELYRKPRYRGGKGHPPDPCRRMVEV